MDPNTVYVLESRLISRDGATQITISGFEARRWHNSRVCVWYFQVCKFFISVNNCSCSHRNFKDIGHMASSTKKCDDYETSSFCVAFGSLSFFLTSTFPPKRTPPALHSFAKCFAASSQHSLLRKNQTSKTAGLCIGVEASFYGWCNANPDFWIWSE